MKRQSGFTLLELLTVVAILAIVLSMAIPFVRDCRKSGNESSAVSAMRTLTSTNSMHLNRYGRYAPSLGELHQNGFIDDVFGAATAAPGKTGYLFTYSSSQYSWSCVASPLNPGQTGDRYFFCDQSGVIRFNTTGSPSASDSPVDAAVSTVDVEDS